MICFVSAGGGSIFLSATVYVYNIYIYHKEKSNIITDERDVIILVVHVTKTNVVHYERERNDRGSFIS